MRCQVTGNCILSSLRGARTSGVLLALPLLLVGAAASQVKHWTETPSELVWHGRYKNCDSGYLLNLPAGVLAHGSRPPSPNHGILISTENPGTTTEVTPEAPRLIDVYDTTDASGLGSAKAYLEHYELNAAKTSEKITILEKKDTQFRGSPAVYVHFRKTGSGSTAEVEELVVYRNQKEIGPLFYVALLRTTPEAYRHDHQLFAQIKDGLQFIPVPKSECSND
jgi:hypothetical protein